MPPVPPTIPAQILVTTTFAVEGRRVVDVCDFDTPLRCDHIDAHRQLLPGARGARSADAMRAGIREQLLYRELGPPGFVVGQAERPEGLRDEFKGEAQRLETRREDARHRIQGQFQKRRLREETMNRVDEGRARRRWTIALLGEIGRAHV